MNDEQKQKLTEIISADDSLLIGVKNYLICQVEKSKDLNELLTNLFYFFQGRAARLFDISKK